jgi:hypothetical protein
MYNNIPDIDIDKEIEKFLSVSEQYDIAKQTALNIMVKASAEDKPEFVDDLNSTIGIVCSLHLLHGLSFDEIEKEAQYIMMSDTDITTEEETI